MLHVVYGRGDYARYECRRATRAEAAPRGTGFSARRPDETVGAEILAVLQGSALSAAIEAGDLAEQQRHDQDRAVALELEQAKYQAGLAARRLTPWTPTTGWWPRSSKRGGTARCSGSPSSKAA